MRAVAGPGRWVWGLSGLVTAVALAFPGVRLITSAGYTGFGGSGPQETITRTATVPPPVTSVTVQSYGAPIRVTAGSTRRVLVTETITYHKNTSPPAVTRAVSGSHLLLAAPACSHSDCSVGFALTVPPGVTVTAVSDGGTVTVSGTAGAKLDSGGGPVRVTRIHGPLTVSTGGGPLLLDGLSGTLRADTGGGPLNARDLHAATATVSTGGGNALIAFSAAPDTIRVDTAGGPAVITVPGGPYALTAESGGGPQSVQIPTNPAAPRSITVSTGGGPLQVGPAAGRPSKSSSRG
jgi:hypothetical protein